MDGAGWSANPAEPEALRKLFSYLVNNIDTTALLSVALSRNLMTDQQRLECSNEANLYKKAEMYLGHIQRAVNAKCHNYHTFVQILQQTDQVKIAYHLSG